MQPKTFCNNIWNIKSEKKNLLCEQVRESLSSCLTPAFWHTPGIRAGSRDRRQFWGVEVWRSARCPGRKCTLASDWEEGNLSHILERACQKSTHLLHQCPQMQTGLSSCTGKTPPSLHCPQTWRRGKKRAKKTSVKHHQQLKKRLACSQQDTCKQTTAVQCFEKSVGC